MQAGHWIVFTFSSIPCPKNYGSSLLSVCLSVCLSLPSSVFLSLFLPRPRRLSSVVHGRTGKHRLDYSVLLSSGCVFSCILFRKRGADQVRRTLLLSFPHAGIFPGATQFPVFITLFLTFTPASYDSLPPE